MSLGEAEGGVRQQPSFPGLATVHCRCMTHLRSGYWFCVAHNNGLFTCLPRHSPPPRSILLDDRWRVKIADFGLSRVRSHTLVSGTGAGTPGAHLPLLPLVGPSRQLPRTAQYVHNSFMCSVFRTLSAVACLPRCRVDGARGAALRGL